MQCNFYLYDASIYANSGVSGLKKCFETAKNNERSVIFIDELDGIAYKGSAATFLLQTELDGYVSEKSSNLLVVIAATNYPNKIADAALNRFTEEVVPLPDQKQRSELFSFYIRQIKQKCDKTLSELDTVSQELAKITSLFAPRDIKNLIDRALRYYMVKQDKDETILFSLTDILDACKAQKRQVMDRMAVNTYPPSYYGNQKSEVEEHSLSLSSGRFIDQVPKPILHNFSAGKMTASTEQALTNKASVQVESAGMQMNKN